MDSTILIEAPSLRSAYITTINDFEIALRHCSWYEFKYIRWLNENIKKYEKLLKELPND